MSKIHILPEEIKSKIAAGEVIERPASVVKELIENSFDAGANFINISFRDGGIKEISVYDDGEGMDSEDLKLCYKHHATSKIKSLADIFKIVTFGFRGEALASIARVSKLTIISKTFDSPIAYEIKIEYGKEKDFKPSRLSQGTLVKVEDLFSNLPARKAFLKSPRSEAIKILEIVKALSLCHPEIKIQAKNEKRTVFLWEGGTIKSLISYITGIEENKFQEIVIEKSPYQIHLVLTDTSTLFSHTKYIYTLVNKRLIKDEKLNRIILSAFKTYYGNLGFPAGLISIKAPYHLVDVNVHPAKWEIRFKNEKDIFKALDSALEELFHLKRKSYFVSQGKISQFKVKEDLPLEYNQEFTKKETTISSFPSIFPCQIKPFYKYLGTFLNTYFLIEKDKELYIIDQHALSERIIFENLKNKFQKALSQELLIPILLKISDSAFINWEEKNRLLKEAGFELELFGNNEVILKKMPTFFKEDIKSILEKILEEDFSNPEDFKLEILKRYSCLLARKKGEILSQEEIQFLINEMFSKNLKTCPHGRPLYFKLSLSEIESRLKRR